MTIKWEGCGGSYITTNILKINEQSETIRMTASNSILVCAIRHLIFGSIASKLIKSENLENGAALVNITAAPRNVKLPFEEEFDLANPTLLNINSLLAPFGKHGCFIHLTSYDNAPNFKEPPQYPWLIRHLTCHRLIAHALRVSSSKGVSWVEQVTHVRSIWIMSKTQAPIDKPLNHCVNSSYFAASEHSDFEYASICTKLNFLKFSSKIKPWRCEVCANLFPPALAFHDHPYPNILDYPRIWHFDTTLEIGSYRDFPCAIPKFNVFVVNTNVHRWHWSEDRYAKWVKQYFHMWYGFHQKFRLLDVSTDMFFIVETMQNESQETIFTTWNIKICLSCGTTSKSLLSLQEVSLHDFATKSIFQLVTLASSQPEEMTRWTIESHSFGHEGSKSFVEYFNVCDNHVPSRLSDDVVDFSKRAVTHIWRVIMGNFTHPIYRSNAGSMWQPTSSQCSQAKKHNDSDIQGELFEVYSSIDLRIMMKAVANEYYLFRIPNDLFTLRFVSCGRPPISPLAFKELFSSFQLQVWLSIFAIILVSILFKRNVIEYGQQKFDFHAAADGLEYFKILVDQGDAFMKLRRNLHWRNFYGLYLLMALVLSNAYQNENVLNMIKPRMPIPYEIVSQLITDGFTIFSRLVFTGRFEVFPDKLSNMTPIRRNNHYIVFDLEQSPLVSEVAFFNESDETKTLSKRNRRFLSELLQHSQLHPDILNVFEAVQTDYHKHRDTITPEMESLWVLKLTEGEQTVLERSLEICDKVALIVPEYLARNISRKLRYNPASAGKHYVGKEEIHKTTIGFQLQGYVPMRVFSRLKAISWAGIWDRWRKLTESLSGRQVTDSMSDSVPSRRPTMEGNMLILFVVLLIGQGLSILIFLAEMFKCLM